MQEALPIEASNSLAERDFLVLPSNKEAFERVLAPAQWGASSLRLVGPAGSGKSHLAAIFAQRFPQADVIDGVETHAETTLFHRLNALGSPCLFTARDGWTPALPDLASRWNALPLVRLAPDDTLLRALLEKHFADRQLRVTPELLDYLEKRMERSPQAVRALVESLDREAWRRGVPIGLKLAREMIEDR